MVSAISSVTMFRRGLIEEHPYGFYRSASYLLPHIPLIGSVQGIQNLLMIARFAMYYHIGIAHCIITSLAWRSLTAIRMLDLGHQQGVHEAMH